MLATRFVQEAPDAASSPATSPTTNPAASPVTYLAVDPTHALPTVQPLDHYAVDAAADPGVLPRAIELLAKRGLVPVFLRAETRQKAHGEARLSLEIATDALEPMAAAHVAACLRQIWGVDTVTHEMITHRPARDGGA